MIQWLRSHAPSAGDLGLIPGQRTRSHMLQLVHMLQLKKLTVATGTAKLINFFKGFQKAPPQKKCTLAAIYMTFTLH